MNAGIDEMIFRAYFISLIIKTGIEKEPLAADLRSAARQPLFISQKQCLSCLPQGGCSSFRK